MSKLSDKIDIKSNRPCSLFTLISTFRADVFNGLDSLQQLHLWENKISMLPEGIFSRLNNLQELHLYQNEISTLPMGIFSGLDKLRNLGLHSNNLGSEYCTSLRNQLSILSRRFSCD